MKRIAEKRPDDFKEYQFMEEYTGSHNRINTKHLPCGEEIMILPNSFISRGSGCPKCNRLKSATRQRKTHQEYIKELPEGMQALEEYSGAFTKVKVYCTLCDSTYRVRPHDLLREGGGCTRCSGRYNRTLEDVVTEISALTKGEYLVVSDSFISSHCHIKIRHTVCDTTYEVTRHNFMRGRRCPICRSSIGETLIMQVLKEHRVKFERQKRFQDLVFKNPLSYDFYLPEYNLLIEYQGIQHYKPVKLFGGEEQFKIQRKIDNTKKVYADSNKFNFLEIPYTVRTFNDVEAIINKAIYD